MNYKRSVKVSIKKINREVETEESKSRERKKTKKILLKKTEKTR